MKFYLIAVLLQAVYTAANSENPENSENSETFTKIQENSRKIAEEGQFPFQVSLRSRDDHFCSGAILNNRFILTSAVCVDGKQPSLVYAILGEHRLSNDGHRVDIDRIKVHESFDPLSQRSNIALLRTTQEILMAYGIQRIQLLPSNWTNDEDMRFAVSGWDLSQVS